MKLTAVIIEDEDNVRDAFIKFLKRYCPEIDILADTDNITEGYELIVFNKPNVVFLDIEMPGGNGFELLNKFNSIDFEVVFVSSHDHYAIRALKLSALDYILKPVLSEELIELVHRLKEAIILKENALKYEMLKKNLVAPDTEKKLIVTVNKMLVQINLSEIIYLEADLNYTRIYTLDGKKYLLIKCLKEYDDILCGIDSSFFRIHKTFIVNISFVKHIETGNNCIVVMKNGLILEVSRRRKADLFAFLKNRNSHANIEIKR